MNVRWKLVPASLAVCAAVAVMTGYPAAAEDDPVLNGVYALHFGDATADGVPGALPRATYWYDFHMKCPGGDSCSAVGHQVNTDDRSGQSGFDTDISFQFVNGEWIRSWQADSTCPDGSILRTTSQWSLTPQADGTLTGERLVSASGGCTKPVIRQPIVATRS